MNILLSLSPVMGFSTCKIRTARTGRTARTAQLLFVNQWSKSSKKRSFGYKYAEKISFEVEYFALTLSRHGL